jgi:tripartite-type tricarboxylate transporter receptor subunit TctC
LLIWINIEAFLICEQITMWRKALPTFAVFSTLLVVGMGGLLRAAEPTSKDNDYPNRTITIIVPWAPGGPSDMLSRIVASGMSRTLRQQILVENVVGAGGTTAALRVKRAPPDGYMILTGNTGTHAAVVALYPQLGYDPRTDFEPIGILAIAPIVIVARRDFPPKDLKEFVRYLKANAHKLDEGHGGIGSIPFTACLVLNHMIGVRPRLVSYDGAAPAMEALVRGRIDYMCDQTINAVPQVRGKRVKAYAVAAPERNPALPDVPTTAEGGLPEYQLSAWQAMFAPKGVPKTVIEKLNDALVRALDDEAVRDNLLDLGASIPEGDQRMPQALADLMKKEIARWKSAVKAAGMDSN